MRPLYLYFIGLVFLSSCDPGNLGSSFISEGSISQGGSTAKFAISGDYLYVIEDTKLSTFNISSPNETRFLNKISLNTIQLETIFPFGNLLFLGSTTGILIIDISNKATPRFISEYQHVLSCDPVVTDGAYAYVTLRSGNICGQVDDVLQIIDLSNILEPVVITEYLLTSPKGLALNGNILYVCDAGIKIFDVTDKLNIRQINQIPNIPANDVIYFNNQLLVTADNGFYQFDVADNLAVTQIGQFAY